MEIIFEFFLQIFGELFVQILFELGFRSIAESFSRNRPLNPGLAAFGYFLFGLIAGCLSLLILPHHLTPTLQLRVANLVLAPIVVGFGMNLLGNIRDKKELSVIGIDRFSYGFCFALSMAIVRFYWAK